jgi:hypothetical protein
MKIMRACPGLILNRTRNKTGIVGREQLIQTAPEHRTS